MSQNGLTARDLIRALLGIEDLDTPVAFPATKPEEVEEEEIETLSADPTTIAIGEIEETDGEILLKPVKRGE